MKSQKDIKKGEGNMRYKVELSIMIVMLFGLSLAGVASADSVTKTLYVDGVRMGTSTATQAISFPYQRLTIGSEGSRYYPYNGLVGQIDEFAVFGRVLTDTNVADLYNAGQGGYVAAVTSANPLLYLRFEDANSSNGSKVANSGSLTDVNSTYIGAVDQNASGYVGKAAILHGATGGTGDCIDVCDWDARLSLTDISVAFWVKTTQSSDYPRLFQHNGGGTEEHSYGAMYSAGTNSIGLIGGGNTSYINSTINNGQWHHIVVTFNSIQPGPYATEVMADDPCVYLKFDNQMPVDSSGNGYFAGLTGHDDNNIGLEGDFAIVRKTAGGMGLSLYLNNTIKSASSDNGGHSNAVAYVWNNWWATPGLPNEYTRCSPPTDWTVNNDGYAFAKGTISFEVWIKSILGLAPDQFGVIFQQVGSWTKEPNAPLLGLYTDAGVSKLRVAGGSQWYYPGTVTPLDGQWHQLVVTYDENEADPGGSMGIQLYLDGSLAGQTTIYDPNNHQALLGPELKQLIIGCENDQGYPYNCYSGYVDEFSVYPVVLSADRVAAHYAAWQPKDCAEVKARGMTLPGDLNGDCQVDFYDYAIFASEWRLCDNPGGAGCGPNW